MKTILRFLLTLVGFLSLEAHAGNLRVNLAPSSAVSAGAQWRVDGGTWRNSGATANGLSNGTHTVDYKTTTGWIAPAAQSVTLSGGTTTLSATYVQAAALKITLVPSSAQWRVDGGAWRSSATTATGLAPGNHTVEYGTVAGYTTPAPETVALTSGQTTTLTRSYAQLASLSLTLTPGTAQWRVDGGAWLASGATATDLTATTHTISFAAVEGYLTPASESITLSAGQSVSLSRSYVQMGEVWLNLVPSAGQWRANGGPWQPSGGRQFFAPGTYTIDYAPVAHYLAPASNTVTLDAGGIFYGTIYYTALSQLTVTLTPGTAQWRVDGGAWQASGATVTDLSNNTQHFVDYAPLAGYATPASESVYAFTGQQLSLSRSYVALPQVSVTLTPATGQWRVDGGAWQASGATVGSLAANVTHTIDYSTVAGYLPLPAETFTAVNGQIVTLARSYATHYSHRLRFFLHQDLVGSMPIEEVRRRISQYAAHLTLIFNRETKRTFTFDAAQDISIVTANPFSNSFTGTLPEIGFEVWVYAQLSDNPTFGTYGGNAGFDTTGAGGAYNLRWDQIHDPAALVDNTPAMAQYWRQLDHITHEFEHTFGAGMGEYYSMAGLKDSSGVAPILPNVEAANSATVDAFWSVRSEYWSDPLLAEAYANARLGSPTSLATLLDITSFAPVTEGIINGLYRDYSRWTASLPNMSGIVVKVVDATTGQPIPGATLRVWNRNRPVPPYDTYEETVSTTATAGVFTFAWTGAPLPLNNYENAKILKAYAAGYTPVAQWVTAYDAQKAKVVEGQTTFEVTIALTPQ